MQKLTIVAAVTLSACTASDPTDVVMVDSAGVTIIVSGASGVPMRSLGEPSLELGSVDGGADQFHLVRALLRLPSGDLVVANAGSDELRRFARDGAFSQTIGGRGNGPGELSGLATADLVGDSILTYDHRNDRITVFDLDGSYVRSFRLEWSGGLLGPEDFVVGVGVLSSRGTHMVDLQRNGVNVDTATVSLHDFDGNLVKDLVRLPHNQRFVRREGDRQTTLGVPLTSHAAFLGRPQEFCYAFGPSPEVRCFDWEGGLRRILRLDEEPREVTAAEVVAYQDQFADRPDGDRPAMQSLLAAMPYPEYMPAFDRLISGPGDELWARRFRMDTRSPEEWVAFGANGAVVATLVGSDGVEILRVVHGEALTRVRDELDVEHVVTFPIRPD